MDTHQKKEKNKDEEEEYSKQQLQYIRDIKIGDKDRNGLTVVRIFSRGDDFIVYDVDVDIVSESLKVLVMPEDYMDPNGFEKKFTELKPELNEVKAILYKAKRDNSFKQIIASAISIGIAGDVEKAKTKLIKIKNRIDKEFSAQFNNKLIYMSVSFAIAATLIILSSCYLHCLQGETCGNLEIFIFSITGGSIGGVLSLSLKLKKVDVEASLCWTAYIFYGVERMFLSVIVSIVAIVLLKSKMIFGFVEDLDNPMWGYILVGIISGFSESFIPDILNKIENENK